MYKHKCTNDKKKTEEYLCNLEKGKDVLKRTQKLLLSLKEKN